MLSKLDALVNAHDQVSVTPTHENRPLSTQLGGEGTGEGGVFSRQKDRKHPSIDGSMPACAEASAGRPHHERKTK